MKSMEWLRVWMRSQPNKNQDIIRTKTTLREFNKVNKNTFIGKAVWSCISDSKTFKERIFKKNSKWVYLHRKQEFREVSEGNVLSRIGRHETDKGNLQLHFVFCHDLLRNILWLPIGLPRVTILKECALNSVSAIFLIRKWHFQNWYSD